jgi:hypothetical protein
MNLVVQALLPDAASNRVPVRRMESGVVPRAVLQLDTLSYRLLSSRAVDPADAPLLAEAYRCWSDVWHETFLELDNVSFVPSDDFTRQDEVGAIFHGGECIAMSLFRWVDLADPMHRGDSYFAVWPDDAVRKACRDGSRVCVGSNIVISPAWRSALGCSLKYVLAGLIIERFAQAHDGAAMVGTMRKDRGMDKLMDRVGAERLGFTVKHHGVDVELFAYFRDSCRRPALEERDEVVLKNLATNIRSR